MSAFTVARAMRAIRALAPGGSYTSVLFDRQAYGDQPMGQSSLRVVVTRTFGGEYEAELQEYRETSRRGEWTYFGFEHSEQVQDLWLALDDLPIVLAYYAHLARHDWLRAVECDEREREEASV